jgi:hypothetical protein
MAHGRWRALVILVVLVLLFYTQFTIFIAPPAGAVTDGRALVMFRFRLGEVSSEFIDSPDAMCERRQGYADSICRSVILNAVEHDSTVLVRLPYPS